MTRRSRKMPLEDIFNRLYSRSEPKKPDPNLEYTHASENTSQKRKPKRDSAHTDEQATGDQKEEPKRAHTNGQKGTTQDGEQKQASPDADETTAQEEEYVWMLHRVKERFYTSNGNIAHVSEEKPMLVALLRAIPIRKDAECNITVDAEDPN